MLFRLYAHLCHACSTLPPLPKTNRISGCQLLERIASHRRYIKERRNATRVNARSGNNSHRFNGSSTLLGHGRLENRGRGGNRNGIIRYNVASLPFLATISWNNFPRCRRTNESFPEVKNRISRRGHISSVVFIRPHHSSALFLFSSPMRSNLIPPQPRSGGSSGERREHARIADNILDDARGEPGREKYSKLALSSRPAIANKAERVGEMSPHTWARYGRPLHGRHCK